MMTVPNLNASNYVPVRCLVMVLRVMVLPVVGGGVGSADLGKGRPGLARPLQRPSGRHMERMLRSTYPSSAAPAPRAWYGAAVSPGLVLSGRLEDASESLWLPSESVCRRTAIAAPDVTAPWPILGGALGLCSLPPAPRSPTYPACRRGAVADPCYHLSRPHPQATRPKV